MHAFFWLSIHLAIYIMSVICVLSCVITSVYAAFGIFLITFLSVRNFHFILYCESLNSIVLKSK